MPARKRNAKALAVINEDEADKCSKDQAITDDVAMDEADASTIEDQVRKLVEDCRGKVVEEVDRRVAEGRQRAEKLRAASGRTLSSLNLKVRQMTAADFFKLTPEESASNTIPNFLQRLQRLALEDAEGAEAAGLLASSLAPPAGSGTLATEQAAQEQQSGPSDLGPSDPQQRDVAPGGAASGSPKVAASAVALMPPPPPRQALTAANPPARAPKPNEVVYSMNGSPIYVNGAGAPMTSVKGATGGLTDATPAVGLSCVAMPPTAFVFTGRTCRRATAARGRKQPTREITITTSDGKQFIVDDLIGLAGVPQKYREEVRRLMKADLEDLNVLARSVEAIEEADSVLPGLAAAKAPEPARAPEPAKTPKPGRTATRASRRR